LTSVNLVASIKFADWLARRGQQTYVLNRWQDLPLRVALEHPECAGIDRLLNAVAASHSLSEGKAAMIVDAGSAITVDLVDESGAFRGGAIAPGLRLMSKALHDYTALLPVTAPPESAPIVPASTTDKAVQAGVYWSAAGGIRALVEHMGQGLEKPPKIFLTGGDARVLSPALEEEATLWPEMTLEGIRLAIEALA
jgi:type III pantothenate kinase